MSWRDQLSDEALRVLESSDSDQPSSERLDRIGKGIAAAGATAVTTAVVTAASMGVDASTGTGAAGAAGSTSGAATASSAAASSAASTGSLFVLGTPVKLLLAVLAFAGVATGYRMVGSVSETPRVLPSEASPTNTSPPAQQTTPFEVASPLGPNVPAVELGIGGELEQVPVAIREHDETQRARRGAAVAADSANDDAVDVDEELQAIQRIQRLTQHDPEAALQLIASVEARGDERFAPERELYRIEALVRLERRSLAQQAAQRFHERFPRSAYGERIRTLVTEEAVTP